MLLKEERQRVVEAVRLALESGEITPGDMWRALRELLERNDREKAKRAARRTRPTARKPRAAPQS